MTTELKPSTVARALRQRAAVLRGRMPETATRSDAAFYSAATERNQSAYRRAMDEARAERGACQALAAAASFLEAQADAVEGEVRRG